MRTRPTENTNIVEPSCGTSYSTANVAGVAALWLAHHDRQDLVTRFEGLTKLQFIFKRLLQHTARQPNEWNEDDYGSGIVDAKKLLKADPNEVRKEATDDFEEFKKYRRKSTENNLKEISNMYYRTWFNQN